MTHDYPTPDDIVPCTWCMGEGVLEEYPHVADGVCFRCGGSGQITYGFAKKSRPRVPIATRWWDPEYVAEVAALREFGLRYGLSGYERLEDLRDSDYKSYVQAVRQLREGRLAEVAQQLAVTEDDTPSAGAIDAVDPLKRQGINEQRFGR